MRSTKVRLDQFTIFTSSKSTTLYWVRAHKISFIFSCFDFMWMGVHSIHWGIRVRTHKLIKTRVVRICMLNRPGQHLHTFCAHLETRANCYFKPLSAGAFYECTVDAFFIHLLANYLVISIHRLKNWLLKVVVNFFFDSFRCKWCRQPKVDTYYFKKIFCPFISLTNWNPHKLDCVGRQKLGHIFQLYGCIWFIVNG